MRGKIVAAGVSVAVGSTLVGFMAAGDHSADASQTNPSCANTSSLGATGDSGNSSGTTATPADGRTSNDGFGDDGFGDDRSSSSSDDSSGSVSPQPQTRTGGS